VGLRVGQLKAARVEVMSVKREASLSEARTKMMLHDYSQLAVWNGRGSDVMAVTWESIAKAQLCRQKLRCLTRLFLHELSGWTTTSSR
jgi:predicted transcriptional regulator